MIQAGQLETRLAAAYERHGSRQGGSGWSCILIVVAAVMLVGTGVVSVGFLVFALACTVMTALMTRGLNGNGTTYERGHQRRRRVGSSTRAIVPDGLVQ